MYRHHKWLSFGAADLGLATNDDLTEACGSPFEVQNVPALGNHYPFMVEDRAKLVSGQDYSTSVKMHEEELDFPTHSDKTKAMAWTNAMLKAPDQLRQRMAWALQQILVVANAGLGRKKEHECFFAYHDIMVRHAFGSYSALLKEVAFAPIMGEYLTHLQNKAQAYTDSYPDENFAREIMQLFTIGLWKLNSDGTRVDPPQPTYNNEDITAFARVWIGFDFQQSRANMEQRRGSTLTTPLTLCSLSQHGMTACPKQTSMVATSATAIRCATLARTAFLARRCKYMLTGVISAEGAFFDNQSFAQDSSYGRFRPDPTPGASSLYAALCAPLARVAIAHSHRR